MPCSSASLLVKRVKSWQVPAADDRDRPMSAIVAGQPEGRLGERRVGDSWIGDPRPAECLVKGPAERY